MAITPLFRSGKRLNVPGYLAKICLRKETVYKTINPISVHRKHLLVNSFFSSISASYPVRFKASLLVKGLTSSLPQQIKMHTASLSSRVCSEVFKVGRRTRRIIKTRTYSHLYTKETTDRLTEGKYSLAMDLKLHRRRWEHFFPSLY